MEKKTISKLDGAESSQKVAEQSAEFVAMLFVYLAEAIIDSVGQERGNKILRKGLREFGKARGRRIREKVDSLGLKPSIETFTKYYDFPMFAAYKGTREMSTCRKDAKISFCPLADFWKKGGHETFGLLYCDEVDDGIREGFDPDLLHSNPQNPLRGHPICQHIDEYNPAD